MVALVKADLGRLHNWQVNSDEAKKEIWNAVGDIGGVKVVGSQVLLGVYLRPSVRKIGTAGSTIIIPGDIIKEDVFQGKVAMILKFGESALPAEDDPHRATFLKNWGGEMPKVGDWVYSDVKQAFMLSIAGAGGFFHEDRKLAKDWTERGWPARLVYAKDIYGTVEDPNSIV